MGDIENFAARLSGVLRDSAATAGQIHIALEVPARLARLEKEHTELRQELSSLRHSCLKMAAAIIGTWITLGAILVVLGAILTYRVAH